MIVMQLENYSSIYQNISTLQQLFQYMLTHLEYYLP